MEIYSGINANLANARSLLFVPGNRPDRFAKALSSGADVVVLDLEDSVSDDQKAAARVHISDELSRLSAKSIPVVVRINSVQSSAGQADLDWLSKRPRVDGVMVAKAESPQQLQLVRNQIATTPILPLIESAAGFVNLANISGADGVLRLVIGHIDFTADTGIRCSDNEQELNTLRFHVAIQTRMHKLATPVDGVTVEIEDSSRLTLDTKRALNFGFGGKLCIHPKQIAIVHHTLAPTERELDWACRVIVAFDASGGAAVRVDNQMVDVPVAMKARATIARAAR